MSSTTLTITQRLAHSYDNQVMDDCAVTACGSAYTYPQSHDKSDYYSIW
jgi:hypothetical protein